MSRPTRIILLLCACLAGQLALSSSAGALSKHQVGNFDSPVYVTGSPGSPKLLFVVEQAGRVRVIRNGRKLRRPFLDIRGLVGTDDLERGLLSIAFPPDYEQSGFFYVFFTDNEGDLRVEEFRRRTFVRARRGSERVLLEIEHSENGNHNGGQLQFFRDLLYIGTGDGGSANDPPNNALNVNSLLGKILRIHPRPAGGAPYSVPSSNPFVGRNGRDEVYSYGLRNPWRFSFDTFHGGGPYIAIGDVGQDEFEEIDYETLGTASGANFGWDAWEGFSPANSPDPGGTVKPILAYSLGGGTCAVTGGYVVTGSSLPGLRGRYLYGDFCRGQIRSFVPQLGGARGDRPTGVNVPNLSSFGVDESKRIYAASLDGPVYRLVKGG